MDDRAKMFNSIDFRFFKLLLRTENELLVSEMHEKIGGQGLRFRDKG